MGRLRSGSGVRRGNGVRVMRAAAAYWAEALEGRVMLAVTPAVFQGQQTFATGIKPHAVVSADVNLDGKLDLVVANLGANTVGVLLGNGNGTFQMQRTFGTGSQPISVSVADVNLDGKPDVVVAHFAGNSVGVLKGNGDGTFQNQLTFAAAGGPASIAVADVNGDGKPDVVAALYSGNGAGVLLGNGNGTLAGQQTFGVGSHPIAIATGDLNSDGKVDLALADFGGGAVSTLLGSGNGTFGTHRTFGAGTQPRGIAIADLNGDGKLDVAAANFGSASVGVLLGNGSGALGVQQTFGTGTGSQPLSVATADLNRDGKLDLAVANFGSNTLGSLLGNGNGSLNTEGTWAAGTNPMAVAVADVNGDGRLDLMGANYNGGSASVLLGDVPPYVVSINRSNPAGPTTSASSVTFAVTFSEPVTGVDATDFSVAVAGSVTVNTTMSVVGAGTAYAVTVSGISGNGTLGLNLIDNGSIHDGVGNALHAGGASTSFAAQATYGTGFVGSAVAADVNGDGKVDLIAVNRYGGSVGILLGNGDGTFKSQQSFASGSTTVYAVATADVNGDGRLDLVAAIHAPGARMSVLLGNGNGTFQAAQTFAVSYGGRAVAATDFDGDGKVDVLIPTTYRFGVIRAGNGDGTFGPIQTFSDGRAVYSIAVSDVNGDGKSDLVLTAGDFPEITVLIGNGNGTFGLPQTFASGPDPKALAVGDVNRDGKVDLAVVDVLKNYVGVLLGNGNGTFMPQQTIAAGSAPYSVEIADMNGDGMLDVVVSDRMDNAVSVLPGDGKGSFGGQRPTGIGVTPRWAGVSDVNADGRPDVLVANTDIAAVGVLLGRSDFAGQVYTVTTQAPVTWTVTSPADDGGSGTLRYAVNHSTQGDTIRFEPAVFAVGSPQTIALTHAQQLVVDHDLTITGPGRNVLNISANGQGRDIQVNPGVKLSISGATLSGASERLSGGAIYGNGGSVVVSDCNFGSDRAVGGGGAVYTYLGDLTVTNCLFDGVVGDSGGAVAVEHGSLTANGCQFQFGQGGAVRLIDVPAASIENCTFRGNRGGRGGGINSSGQTALQVVNCTFQGNESNVEGGAVANDAGALTIINSTIYGNSSDFGIGGGIWNGTGSVTLYNSIVAKNFQTNASVPTTSDVTGTITGSYNLVGDGSGSLNASLHNLMGTPTNPLDPNLGELSVDVAGGMLGTMVPLSGSAAIDAGSNALVAAGIQTDERGFPRVTGGTVDLGAAEATYSQLVVNTVADETTAGDGALSLREAIGIANATTLQDGPTIVFDPAVFPAGVQQTMTITGGQLVMSHSMTIQGPGSSVLKLTSSTGRVLTLGEFIGVALTGVTIDGVGGGMAVWSQAFLTLRGVSFSNNHAGALYSGGPMVMVGCTFTGNSGGSDATAFNSAKSLSASGCNFVNNSSSGGVVPIAASGPSVFARCTFSGNGAGVILNAGRMSVVDCVFTSNTASTGVGSVPAACIYSRAGTISFPDTLAVNDCAFSLNMAPNSIGAINDETYGSITNCTFWENSGALVNPSQTRVTNCTIVGNGFGILSAVPVVINNSIVAGNGNDLGGNGGATGSNNLIGVGDAQLVPFGDHGGPTPTMPPAKGSAAIDAGSNALAVDAAGVPLQTDQRGYARFVNGTVDIGAAEYQANEVSGTAGADAVTLRMSPDHQYIQWTAGGDSGSVPVGLPLGLIVNGNGGTDAITLDYTNGNPLPNTIHLNGTFTINGLQGSNPLAGATLDVERSTVRISYAGPGADPLNLIKQYLVSGYNGAGWDGVSAAGVITSADAKNTAQHNTGVAWVDSAEGSPLNNVANTILLTYAAIGDTDLDGTVGLSDYTAVVRNFGVGTNWTQGVVTYGASVGLADYTAVVRNFGQSPPAVPTAVPAVEVVAAGTDTASVAGSVLASAPATVGSGSGALAGITRNASEKVVVAPVGIEDLKRGKRVGVRDRRHR